MSTNQQRNERSSDKSGTSSEVKTILSMNHSNSDPKQRGESSGPGSYGNHTIVKGVSSSVFQTVVNTLESGSTLFPGFGTLLISSPLIQTVDRSGCGKTDSSTRPPNIERDNSSLLCIPDAENGGRTDMSRSLEAQPFGSGDGNWPSRRVIIESKPLPCQVIGSGTGKRSPAGIFGSSSNESTQIRPIRNGGDGNGKVTSLHQACWNADPSWVQEQNDASESYLPFRPVGNIRLNTQSPPHFVPRVIQAQTLLNERNSRSGSVPVPLSASGVGPSTAASAMWTLPKQPIIPKKPKDIFYSKTPLVLSRNRQSKITNLLNQLTATVGSSNSGIEGYGDPSISSHNFRRMFTNNLEANLTVNNLDQQNGNTIKIELKRIPRWDDYIKEEMAARKRTSQRYTKMLEFRKSLPAYNCRKEIMQLIFANQVVVLSGETGCGKTTQVPQFILDKMTADGNASLCNVVCTQPRRISAITVAERVAEERDEYVGGDSVGYSIRLENRLPQRRCGTISFLVIGVLIQRLKNDPYLRNISHIIVDEIHERDVLSDFLLVILKDLLLKRPDLKVVLMSATLNASKFSKYFDNCPVFEIPGFTFPVTEYYLEDVLEQTGFRFYNSYQTRARKPSKPTPDFTKSIIPYVRQLSRSSKYSSQTISELMQFQSEEISLDLIEKLLDYICRKDQTNTNGSVLIFLPGWDRISSLIEQLRTCGRFPSHQFLFYPLHSQLPTLNQKEVFTSPPFGVRKVIVATNIAETSITIDDIVYVIDCGKIKMTNFDSDLNLETLDVEWVSRANAKQRKGRAGRVQAGVCYHLFTRGRESLFEDFKKPEILRTKLEETVLKIKMLKMGDAAKFLSRLCDPPRKKSLEHALSRLVQINALDSQENLTPLGFHLATLPMDPYTGRMVLMSAIFSCCDPILTCAASLNSKDCFNIPFGKEDEVDKIRKRFAGDTKSDHIAVIRAVEAYEQIKFSGDGSENYYCYENFLSRGTMELIIKMKAQFANHLYEMDFLPHGNTKHPEMNINSQNTSLIKAIICAGLYPNLVHVYAKEQGKKKRVPQPEFSTPEDGRVNLAKKSVNASANKFESEFFVYHMKMKTTSIYVHDTTLVTPFPLLFFGGQLDFNDKNGKPSLGVDGNIRFVCTKSIFEMVRALRNELDKFLEYKIEQPGPTEWNESDHTKTGILLRAIRELLTSEHNHVMGLNEEIVIPPRTTGRTQGAYYW